MQVSGYLHIAAAPWPRFGGSDGYPIDVELDVARRQSRRTVLPRLFLALPAFLLAAAIGGGVWFGDASWTGSNDSAAAWSVGASAGGLAATAAFLAWFASVAKGRTPRGLRDLAAYGIAYTAQVSSYLLLDHRRLSDAPTPTVCSRWRRCRPIRCGSGSPTGSSGRA